MISGRGVNIPLPGTYAFWYRVVNICSRSSLIVGEINGKKNSLYDILEAVDVIKLFD